MYDGRIMFSAASSNIVISVSLLVFENTGCPQKKVSMKNFNSDLKSVPY